MGDANKPTVVLCFDNNFMLPAGVCITSLLENNQDWDFQIIIITSYISDKNRERIHCLEKAYGKIISIVTINDQSLQHLRVRNTLRIGTYYRFLIPEVLDFEKALYIDGDIIINGSIKEIFDYDISDYACGVVIDQSTDDIREKNRFNLKGTYFNAGVLLMNLGYWRENSISQKALAFVNDNPEKCFYLDQDALNNILDTKVRYLPPKYNFQYRMTLPLWQQFIAKDRWDSIEEAQKSPIVIHFTGDMKPWFLEKCENPYGGLFIEYMYKSPWRDEIRSYRRGLITRMLLFVDKGIRKMISILNEDLR